ncbi:unnamed protein product [Dovyalis caffra]|uniref:Germin-like protein n=1 Tax=Dovyalis caffra TaxID=77055 RepID=A0AAV1SW72_9ROSI|nr:unnamed protein product [Dovyalis caffra]
MASHILLVIASFLAIISALATASDPSPLQDFCVADPSSSVRINGLPCMDPKLVNANRFLFRGLHVPTNTSNPLGFGANSVRIPGLNTLGIALARGDFAPRGVAPLHTHPRATEIATVLEGSLLVGFVTSNPENRFISKVVQKGDVFVFPKGLIHFLYNVGDSPASVIVSFSSQDPGFIVVADLFGTNPSIPNDILAKAFQVDESIIRQLRP